MLRIPVTASALIVVVMLTAGESAMARNQESRLPAEYQKWLDEDVRYIISPDERAHFSLLSSDGDRDRFVEHFWLSRDPAHEAAQNKFKEELYRRLAYSNIHFAAGIPGWQTDRGRIYIVYGPPNNVTVRPVISGNLPTQIWHYKISIPGYGSHANLKFVDRCACGDYQLQPSF